MKTENLNSFPLLSEGVSKRMYKKLPNFISSYLKIFRLPLYRGNGFPKCCIVSE